MRAVRRWWWVVPSLLIGVAAGFLAWALMGPGPMPEALAALSSDDNVQVQTDRWLVFRVDAKAYAPAARAIAAEGYLVVIVTMPLNLAVFAPDRAEQVLAAYPQVETWGIGGHSLGGAMAARFACQHLDQVQGLVLWAAYPASADDLSDSGLTVTSIYGTRDGLATRAKIDASRELLPPDTDWVAIGGGNHAQFGWYGPQQGDNEATISRKDQQEVVIAATLTWLSRLADR
jgi:hypothetical protein